MTRAASAAAVVLATAALIIVWILLRDDGGAEPQVVAPTTPAGTATPLPTATPVVGSWPLALRGLDPSARTVLLSCLDTNGDGRLAAGDRIDDRGLSIDLRADEACVDPGVHADFYSSPPRDPAAYVCGGAVAPLLVVAIPSGGSDLLQPEEGASQGMVAILNDLLARAAAANIPTATVLAAPAVFGAVQPQTSMERWLTREVQGRLAALPCLRAVLIGHSHGGVTVTSVTAALDGQFADRMLGVLIDRTIALYDRPASEMPLRTRVLNFFQVNEGWHGTPIDLPNIENLDQSGERAPLPLGPEPALVAHPTLDDSPAVQREIVDRVMGWLGE